MTIQDVLEQQIITDDSKDGEITELFMHPVKSNDPMINVNELQLVADKGIHGNPRYYDTKNKNHISVTEQEQINVFKQLLQNVNQDSNSNSINSSIRSNIITHGLCLDENIGKNLQIGNDVIINVYKIRCSCRKLDRGIKGLCGAVKTGKPGVMCEILTGGLIKVGDKIKQI